jgi:transglutaminase-like putative cysteine protease
MQIRVTHQSVYAYDPPAKSLIQALRLTPRNHDGQYVVGWRIDMDADGLLKPGEDAFGNITHHLSVPGPVERLTPTVTGEVETTDTTGLARGTVERFPPELFLRETDLTRADSAVQDLARSALAEASGDLLGALHILMGRIHAAVALDPALSPAQGAAAALSAGSATARDITHLFIAGARQLGIPARYISGYRYPCEQTSGVHAWAEAMVAGYGWIAFDPSMDLCPVGGHVRMAVGLDYWGAAPVRGTRYGGGDENLVVDLKVEARGQAHQQSQS